MKTETESNPEEIGKEIAEISSDFEMELIDLFQKHMKKAFEFSKKFPDFNPTHVTLAIFAIMTAAGHVSDEKVKDELDKCSPATKDEYQSAYRSMRDYFKKEGIFASMEMRGCGPKEFSLRQKDGFKPDIIGDGQ